MALPPACSDCLTVLQLARAGALPQQTPWQLFRAADGRTRLNFGSVSIINNPAAALRIVLDHTAMEARMLPMPAAGAMPALPGMQMPGLGMPGLPGGGVPGGAMQVLELGRALMEGHQVEGRRYTMAGGGLAEVWTSLKLRLPVLTTMSGSFGQQTCRCKVMPGEPDPSMFQVPSGYRTIAPPPAPAAPGLPR